MIGAIDTHPTTVPPAQQRTSPTDLIPDQSADSTHSSGAPRKAASFQD